jgi:Transglycosylase
MKLILKKRPAIIAISVIGSIVVMFFVFRLLFLNYAIYKISNKLKNDLGLDFSLQSSEFTGFRGLLFKNILISKLPDDTVLYSDSVFLQVKPLALLTGKHRFRKIFINSIKLDMKGDLLDKLLLTRQKINKDTNRNILVNYLENADRFLYNIFSNIPNEIIVDSALLHFSRSNLKLTVYCPGFKYTSQEFQGLVYLTDSINFSECKLKGFVDQSHKKMDVTLSTANKHSVSLPYIDRKWDFTVKFDTLRFIFNYLNYEDDKLSVDAYFQADNFYIQNKRIAPTPVIINNGAADIVCNIGSDYIEVDSASKIAVNNFALSPYFKYSNQSGREITFRVPLYKFEADKLFKSFPVGLFTSIRDIKSTGYLSFQLNCYINLDQKDSVHFNAELNKEDFKIIRFGAANLTMMNDTFNYKVYNDDKQVRNIFIGTQNRDFVKLEEISPFLRYSVLTSEDGGFFYHKGFNEESFSNSIVQNLKEKRFARGGSTITMQLIKNVYLTRNKTISRKLEEMLIVWMIENFHLVSKERMYEVYLNIIEWGPDIYGIKQAAYYYFKKKPSELNLQESIFLASIIPSPRYFKYAFKEPGKLTEYYAWFYQRLPEIMIRRNQILPEDTIGLKPDIKLTGAAKDFLVKPDTVVIDSSEIEEPVFFETR